MASSSLSIASVALAVPTVRQIETARVVGSLNLSASNDCNCITSSVRVLSRSWASLTVETPQGLAEIHSRYSSCRRGANGVVCDIVLDGGTTGCDVPIIVGDSRGGALEWVYVDVALADNGKPLLIMTGCMYYVS